MPAAFHMPDNGPRSSGPFSPLWEDLKEAYRFFRFESSWGQKSAWMLFCFTSFHLAFLVPDAVIIPGERAKVFSGLLCSVTLLVCCFLARGQRRVGTRTELAVSLILAALMVLSSIHSLVPASSLARAFVILSSGLGGFWCARIILADDTGRRIFRGFCLVILAALVCVCILCYFVCGNLFACVDTNPHPVAGRMLLLWFAPLSCILPWGAGPVWIFVLLISGSYVFFLISNLRSACLIPVALLVLAAVSKVVRIKYLIAALMPLAVILAIFFHQLPVNKIGLEFEPAYYRFESYFFSFHIAVKSPLLGIGLTSPRREFLKDYEIRYPYTTKKLFSQSVNTVGTSENVFLSFMAEVGLPFTLLYLWALIVIVTRLFRQLFRGAAAPLFHPLALLAPLAAGLLQCMVTDTLYQPQTTWFFHILLGLVPWGERTPSAGKADSTSGQESQTGRA